MLDEQQLEGLYTPDDPGQRYMQGKVKSGPVKPGKVDDPGASYLLRRPGNVKTYSPLSNVNLNNPDIEQFLGDRGVSNPELTGIDPELAMGEAQSGWNKIGRRLGNLVPNIAAGLVDMVGNVGQLLTEWGDERDYHNGLNEIADSMKDPLGANHHRSNDTWAISDPTWWIDHIGGFAELGATFAIGGLGTAKALGGVGKLISGVDELAAASKFVQAGTQLANSSLISYMMGAQGGAHVYKEVYETQRTKLLAQGMDGVEADIQAKHIAAQSAASTAQLTTLLTIGMNVGAYAPFFKSQERVIEDIISKNITSLQNASTGNIAGAVRGMNAADYADKLFHAKGIGAKLLEMNKIGLEMTMLHFAEKTGTDMGNKGETKGFITQLGELSNIIDRVGNSEGLLSYVMGASMGGLQHYLTHSVIPSKKVDKFTPDGTPLQKMNGEEPVVDAQGKPVVQKTWVTPRAYERDFTKRRFDNIKDAVARDFENFDNANDELIVAAKKKDELAIDQARSAVFDTGRLYAIKAGMTEPWKKTFEQIRDMESEKALDAGYISDLADTTYKDRAVQAIAGMEHLAKVYENLVKRYGKTPITEPLIDMVLARHADIYSTDAIIKEHEIKLAKLEAEEKELIQLNNPQEFSDTLNQYFKQHNSAREVERQLIEDHMILTTGTAQQVDRLLKKYRAVGYGDGDTVGAVNNLDAKLRAKQEQLNGQVKNIEDTLLNTPEYLKWLEKNPGGVFDKFLAEVNKRNNLELGNRFRKAQLDALKMQQDIAKDNLAEMTLEKSTRKFSRKVNEWLEGMRQEAEKAESARTSKLAEMVKDKTSLDRLGKMELNRIAEGYRTRRDEVYDTIARNNTDIARLKGELNKISSFDPIRTSGIKRQLKALDNHNKQLHAEGKKLDSLYKEYQVDTAIGTEPVDKETVTGEQEGKINVSAADMPTTGTTVIPEFKPETAVPVEDRIIPQLEIPFEEPGIADPAITYARMYESLSAPLKGQLTKLVSGMLDGTKGFSLDYFNNAIAKGKITQEKASQVLQAAAEYVKSLEEAKATQEVQDFEKAVPADLTPQKDQVTVSGIEIPETPVVENSEEIVHSVIPENSAYHTGYKIVNAATTGATSTIGYEEGTRIGKKGETIYFKVTKPDALNKELNEDILEPGRLLPGHPLRYEVDVEYEGMKNITDSLSWDENQERVMDTERGSDYLDKNSKVQADEYSIGNVPIKVMDAVTGKYLFHIHKLDWLEAKFPGTKDYRNVVDTITMPDGSVVDNFTQQRELLLQLRQGIVDKYNTEGKATEGQIDIHGKGTGRLILNHQVQKGSGTSMKSKVVPEYAVNRSKPERSMLPDPNLTLIIVDDGKVLNSGRNYQFQGELGFKPEDLPKGAVGAMVPAANGQYMYAPLIGMKVVEEKGKPSAGLNSIARAIELYLLNDGTDGRITAEIDNIQSNTGFNLALPRDLKSFISQYYTYLQGFPDSALSPNADGERIERFLFNIDTTPGLDKTKQIKAGFSMRGDGAQYANLLNGQLHPAFIDMLEDGLLTRSRAINYTNTDLGIKGINSQSAFTDATYVPGKGWKHEQYQNYNEYVKSFSKTPVYGRNQLSDGSYVYTANPHLPIDVRRLDTETQVIAEPNKSAETVNTVPENSHELGANAFDDLFNQMPARRTVQEIGTGSEKSRDLTMAALEKMYNFTPEAQRNGKTVLEVFKDLTTRGHTYLSDGFNPFSRCL